MARSRLSGLVVAMLVASGDGKATVSVTGASDALVGGTLALQGGKLLLAGGWKGNAPEAGDFWVVRLHRDAVFGDDFEGGILRLWSDHADP